MPQHTWKLVWNVSNLVFRPKSGLFWHFGPDPDQVQNPGPFWIHCHWWAKIGNHWIQSRPMVARLQNHWHQTKTIHGKHQLHQQLFINQEGNAYLRPHGPGLEFCLALWTFEMALLRYFCCFVCLFDCALGFLLAFLPICQFSLFVGFQSNPSHIGWSINF